MQERFYNPKQVDIKTLNNISGIYQIRNVKNNHRYIGSSKNLLQRYKFHFNALKRNKHQNPYLQAAYNKYGKENFMFEILEYCNPSIRFNKEQYWLDKFYGEGCYNINRDATNPPDCTGKKHVFTEQHKINLSIGMKRRFKDPEVLRKHREARLGKNTGKDNVNSKPIVCLETKICYDAITEAARAVNAHHSGIGACCCGTLLTYNNQHWMFKEEYDKLSQQDIEEIILTKNKCKQVVCLENNKIYSKLIDAQEDMNIDRTSIRKCCNGLQKTAKNYHFVWYEYYKKLSQAQIKCILNDYNKDRKHKCKCLQTNQIFTSINEAANTLKLSARQITASCKGQKAYTHGYTFEFV